MVAETYQPGSIGAPPTRQGGQRLPRDGRYSTVAIVLHWAIAVCIIFNLSVGYFMESYPLKLKLLVLSLHVSSGMTVLALTVVRVVWRLLHEPPAYPAEMKRWERHTAHVVHFLLYCGMVLMPLTGWAIGSAHPPPGSAGERVQMQRMFAHGPPGMAGHTLADMAPGVAHSGMDAGASPPGMAAGAIPPRDLPPGMSNQTPPTGASVVKIPVAGTGTVAPKTPPQGLAPPGPRGGVKIWFVIPLPAIQPIQMIGREPGGLEAQEELHKDFVRWHGFGGYLMIALLLLHVIGALKHQVVDKHAEFARMGVGRPKPRPF